MEEAKSLVHMFLSALFAALILAAVLALITVGNMVWKAFSNQNDANRRMRDYSQYSAFDGTVVRGQDVIALLHDSQGDPFVLICDASHAPKAIAYTDITADFSANEFVDDSEAGSHLASAIGTMQNPTLQNLVADDSARFNYSSAGGAPKYQRLQEFFLSRGSEITGVSGYLQYNSYVLYDGTNSTDIAGVLLIESGIGGD